MDKLTVNKSIKVVQEVLGLATQIKMKKDELERLNKRVSTRKEKFYIYQINAMEHGKEAMQIVHDLTELIREFGIQDMEMRTLTDALITRLSSKSVNTHIPMMNKYNYSNGNVMVYNKGLGLKYDGNTKRASGIYTILEMLHQHGSEIANYVPTNQKQDIIRIFTKHAETNKFRIYSNQQKKTWKVNTDCFNYLDTDIDGNYMIDKKKISTASIEIINRMGIHIIVSTKTGEYTDGETKLHSGVSSFDLYKIASSWDKIGKPLITIRNNLVKLRANRMECLYDLKMDLSPYLLALTL